MIRDLDLDIVTGQTVLYGLGMLALGFWFGATFVGMLAYDAAIIGGGIGSIAYQPSWVGTVQQTNKIALALFCVCIISILAADYYVSNHEGGDQIE